MKKTLTNRQNEVLVNFAKRVDSQVGVFLGLGDTAYNNTKMKPFDKLIELGLLECGDVEYSIIQNVCLTSKGLEYFNG